MQQSSEDARIKSKLAGDRNWAVAALVLLWLLYAFVFWKMLPFAGSDEVFWPLAVGGGLVLLFNSAAVVAMLSHLSEDRREIYGLDLHYLDVSRNQNT